MRQVYTFAGPRAGDLPFVAYNSNCYQGKIFRIVHLADLVPKARPPVARSACFLSMCADSTAGMNPIINFWSSIFSLVTNRVGLTDMP